jgi:hypothetical protein
MKIIVRVMVVVLMVPHEYGLRLCRGTYDRVTPMNGATTCAMRFTYDYDMQGHT